MIAKDLATELLKHPNFEVKFIDFHQEFTGGPLICESWSNIKVGDIGHSDKVIILIGEID